MSVTDATLRAKYGNAVERMAGLALAALRGGESVCDSLQPLTTADLAAVRIMGPDMFAAQTFGTSAGSGQGQGQDAATAVAQAHRVFPQAGDGDVVVAWHDWATAELASRTGPAQPPQLPDRLPSATGWRDWSLAMARLAPLALPTLDSPLHDRARSQPVPLARGTVRAMLRRDHRTAARLVRWLAWLHQARVPVPLEVPPLITRLRQVGAGSARTVLDLTVAERLLGTNDR
ncbi:hypothetical protein [Streptomyces purpureus]|uniref:Uncharacterized protein n=1 Tax=Streptomyces purpureus TaxID=1951 RepID=A0A918HI73_9ACTN|nr:hypothetical protein [Streptomyces purpureus]GGT62619.1 hypothetical protein GCM10014713_64980 [Streptomyces purpureus]